MNKSDRKEKERMKELETPEEKRARRLAKKLAKSMKEKEKMGWDEEYMGYTNEDNPFGDDHLLQPFVWPKKDEGKDNLPSDDLKKLQKRKMIDSRLELEKVKRRRLERERERAEREREQEMMQREKEAAHFREWEKQEDTFHLQQAKLRSKIRITDNRAKPIDLLAQYISAEEDDLATELTEPYNFLNGLAITDLEDLLEDIKVYLELEQGKNVDYWKDITIVTEEELNKLRKLDPNCAEYVTDRRSNIHPATMEDIAKVFKGKTLVELSHLEERIKEKLKGGDGIDVGYWENLAQQLKAHMARQRLRERHQEQLKNKLFRLKQEQCIECGPLFPSAASLPPEPQPSTSLQPLTSTSAQPSTSTDQQQEAAASSDVDECTSSDDEEDACIKEYVSGRYSPVLLQPEDLPPGAFITDPDEDKIRLQFARKNVLTTGQAERDEDEEFMKRARAGMNAEEASFSVEVPLKPEASIWSEKYRPRKPRFFNRVHTGFEWNKYNQTHYDVDNPPPKVVQGYKFNIFYPDLIEKSKIPQYKVIPCDDRNFAVIRFSAGAPYEDIAFKIVNREWEYSYKRGFRCQFQNNILQLWFHFKRLRYRR